MKFNKKMHFDSVSVFHFEMSESWQILIASNRILSARQIANNKLNTTCYYYFVYFIFTIKSYYVGIHSSFMPLYTQYCSNQLKPNFINMVVIRFFFQILFQRLEFLICSDLP